MEEHLSFIIFVIAPFLISEWKLFVCLLLWKHCWTTAGTQFVHRGWRVATYRTKPSSASTVYQIHDSASGSIYCREKSRAILWIFCECGQATPSILMETWWISSGLSFNALQLWLAVKTSSICPFEPLPTRIIEILPKAIVRILYGCMHLTIFLFYLAFRLFFSYFEFLLPCCLYNYRFNTAVCIKYVLWAHKKEVYNVYVCRVCSFEFGRPEIAAELQRNKINRMCAERGRTAA